VELDINMLSDKVLIKRFLPIKIDVARIHLLGHVCYRSW